MEGRQSEILTWINHKKRTLQVKKGEKIFNITIQESDEEDGACIPLTAHLERALGVVVSTSTEDPGKPHYKKKPCPIRCEYQHPNGLVFFCKVFYKKTLDEKKVLDKNANLCCLCLGRNTKGHLCPVLKCPRCGGL